jgi:hypothetical protein
MCDELTNKDVVDVDFLLKQKELGDSPDGKEKR